MLLFRDGSSTVVVKSHKILLEGLNFSLKPKEWKFQELKLR